MPFEPALLPNDYPRQFVPAQANVGGWAPLEALFADLERRPVNTVEALERWLLDWSELSSAIYEERIVRYIRMTCQTDDAALEKAYLDWVEKVEPRIKQANNRLDRKYAVSQARSQLPRERYAVWDRSIENRAALFREENVPLEIEAAKLAQRYTKVSGAMTVEFQGREHTLPQMVRYLEEPDRALRQQAWELVAARRLRDRDELGQIYDDLLALRQQIARHADFENFRDYAFRQRERFDYTPDDCFRFHQAVEAHVVPLMRALQERRRQTMGLATLRPWDLYVDPEGRPPLRPFDTADKLTSGCAAIFEQVDAELADHFGRMMELRLLDLESRKGKGPGGYQEDLTEHRLPFIFMNAVGRDRDVRVLLHEGGHAFNMFAARSQPLHAYRQPPIEFAEVASMSMELLGGEHLGAFYPPEEAARSKREHLEGIVTFLPWCATIDAFQHWIYTHPAHSQAEREACWLELHRRFGGIESWEGYEPSLRSMWQRQLHLYEYPFYYIEYGIAQLGALSVWRNSRKDWRSAVEAYKRALALGGSRPLPELFEAAGVRFDFGPDNLSRIIESLQAELA